MNIFLFLCTFLISDVCASIVPQVVQTYDDRNKNKEKITALMHCTRQVLQILPDDLHRIIESYHETAWVPVEHLKDPDRWFDFLKARYLCLSYMSGQFAAGNHAGQIEIYDVDASKLMKKLTAHSEPINALAYGAETQSLYSCAYDQRIKIWDSTYTCKTTLTSPYATALLLFDKNRLISGNYFGEVTQWDVEYLQQKRLNVANTPGKGIRSLAKLNDKCLISSSSFDMIELFDMSAGQRMFGLNNSKTFYNDVAVMNDNQFAVIQENNILVYDVRNRQEIIVRTSHEGLKAITTLGKSIVTGDEKGALKLHDIILNGPATSKFCSVGTKDIMALAADPDGTNFVSAAKDPVGTLTHWRYTHSACKK